jgi:hypothetical protein
MSVMDEGPVQRSSQSSCGGGLQNVGLVSTDDTACCLRFYQVQLV